METTKDSTVHEGSPEFPSAASAESALSWKLVDGVIELALHRGPCNELGSASLDELEKFATALQLLQDEAHALIIYSELKPGFVRARIYENCIGGPRPWTKPKP